MRPLSLKICLFLIFGLILIIMFRDMEGYVNGSINNEFIVNMLTKEKGEKGEKIFELYKDVKNYSNREISARSNFKIRGEKNDLKYEEMKEFYINNVKNFTEDEKQSIIESINYLYRNYTNKVPLLKEWNIIKVSKDVDWGFPFTINKYIVLPEGKISGKIGLAKILFHEQIHIMQREMPGVFKDYYKNTWGYEEYKLPSDDWIKKYLVINPDSDDYYKWKLDEDLYLLPLPTTYNKHYKFTENALFLTKDGKILSKDGEPYIESLRNISKYGIRFYNASSLYHPGEIFAFILTDMVFDNLSISTKDQDGMDKLFNNLKRYF